LQQLQYIFHLLTNWCLVICLWADWWWDCGHKWNKQQCKMAVHSVPPLKKKKANC